MTVPDDFSFEAIQQLDSHNPRVQEWQQLMWMYQQQVPGSSPGENGG